MRGVPRFRWSFGIRTLFVAITAFSLVCGGIAYQLNWIRKRHQMLERCIWSQEALVLGANGRLQRTPRSAPGLLWVFGEPGYEGLLVGFGEPGYPRLLTAAEAAIVVEAKRLFPEADVEGEAYELEPDETCVDRTEHFSGFARDSRLRSKSSTPGA